MGRLLDKAIVQLPPDLRKACIQRDVLHDSTQEVADRLGISIVAVRLRLFRAHRRLREKLQDSLRPRTRRQECGKRSTDTSRRQYVALTTTPEFACGD